MSDVVKKRHIFYRQIYVRIFPKEFNKNKYKKKAYFGLLGTTRFKNQIILIYR